ncbi:MAG: hypothetical protein ACRDPG_00395, partial [Nocardioidaceae bacterium]
PVPWVQSFVWRLTALRGCGRRPWTWRASAPSVLGALMLSIGLTVTGCTSASDHPSPQPDGAVKSGASTELTTIAENMAAQNGDPSASTILSAASTHARAVAAVGGGDVVTGNEPVYAVVVIGQFTGSMAKIPAGTQPPTGSALTIVVDASDYSVLDWGIDTTAPDLSQLGTVTKLR